MRTVNINDYTLIVEYRVISSILVYTMRELGITELYNVYNKNDRSYTFIKTFTTDEFDTIILDNNIQIKYNVFMNKNEITQQDKDIVIKYALDQFHDKFNKLKNRPKTPIDKKNPPFDWELIRLIGVKAFNMKISELRIIDSFMLERNLMPFYKPLISIKKWEIVYNGDIEAEHEDQSDFFNKFL